MTAASTVFTVNHSFPLCRIRTMKQRPLQRVISRLRPLVVWVLRLTYPLGRRPVRREPSMGREYRPGATWAWPGGQGRRPTLCRSRTWVRRGGGRRFVGPGKGGGGARGAGGEKKNPRAGGAAPRLFPVFAFPGPGPRAGRVVAEGVARGPARG